MKNYLASSTFAILLICSGCATTPDFPNTFLRPATEADDVVIYSALPTDAEEIGTVCASNPMGLSGLHVCLRSLKTQAGKMGANGVLLIPNGVTDLNNEWIGGVAICVTTNHPSATITGQDRGG